LVRINGDSFKELAQKMMEANSSDAIKAFSAALGASDYRRPGSYSN
jgi:hypothetical protein